jgi:hypothetical protein
VKKIHARLSDPLAYAMVLDKIWQKNHPNASDLETMAGIYETSNKVLRAPMVRPRR